MCLRIGNCSRHVLLHQQNALDFAEIRQCPHVKIHFILWKSPHPPFANLTLIMKHSWIVVNRHESLQIVGIHNESSWITPNRHQPPWTTSHQSSATIINRHQSSSTSTKHRQRDCFSKNPSHNSPLQRHTLHSYPRNCIRAWPSARGTCHAFFCALSCRPSSEFC